MAQLQGRARANRSSAGIGVGARELNAAATVVRQSATARNNARQRDAACACKRNCALAGNSAGEVAHTGGVINYRATTVNYNIFVGVTITKKWRIPQTPV